MRDSQPNRPRLSIAWLVYLREMRDQLRDRRTVFTIAVLPLVLYPLLGSLLLQVAQFSRTHRTSLCLVGAENLPASPRLLAEGGVFASDLASEAAEIDLILRREIPGKAPDELLDEARSWVHQSVFDVVVIVPDGFATGGQPLSVLYNVGSDASRTAHDRLMQLLGQWRSQWVQEDVVERGIDPGVLSPFEVSTIDIAPKDVRSAAFWSKILPFVMLVWAMTGAFYPAIDLVAGEKERGTLETLLCSPALRGELVAGKLAAVTTFSVLTALLNALSMLVTSRFVFRQMMPGGMGGEVPLVPMLWLFLTLLPLAALFSAVALAVAALARSSKEGQYYLMPLMMMALPLVLLPVLPGTELNPGTGLIPVTGMFLLARALMEGQYWLALVHLPWVGGSTGLCLWLATRWARRQFEDESVLFRGGEAWSVGAWVRHLWRDRQGDATVGQAFGCGAIVLIGLFFAKLAVTENPADFVGIAKLVLVSQFGLVLAPTLLMACVLTRSLRQSLRVHRPATLSLPVAVLLGLTLHPAYLALGRLIQHVYPFSDQALAAMAPFEQLVSSAPLWHVILLLAVIPALCEEIAFRGFIFAGLMHNNGGLRAVLVTAALFGMSHGVLQQSLAASVMGLLLGWVALRTGSIIPSVIIHLVNNALSVSLSRLAASDQPWVRYFLDTSGEAPQYHAVWVLVAACIAVTCLIYFSVVQPRVSPDQEAAEDLLAVPPLLPRISAIPAPLSPGPPG